jgi:hypothetical protein
MPKLAPTTKFKKDLKKYKHPSVSDLLTFSEVLLRNNCTVPLEFG